MTSLAWRRAWVLGAILAILTATLAIGRLLQPLEAREPVEGLLPHAAAEFYGSGDGEEAELEKELQEGTQGGVGGTGGESAEMRTAQQQWAEARTAPGIVAPGAYSAAFAQLTGLSSTAGSWSSVTAVQYDADDPRYRDFFSNSSAGYGLVTGRITALAADADGYVYAAGANGGVWRSATGGGSWTPIADSLPSLAGGDLQLYGGALWYATGEANTGGTSYVGTGVYRLASPRTGTFSPADRVGGDELESTTINALRFANGMVWAATLRGIWTHSATNTSGAWTNVLAPNPSYLPGGPDGASPEAAYMNIVNDIAIDPRNANHVIAAVGWRGGKPYNGLYETKNGSSWRKIEPTGALDGRDIGNASFAWSADQSKLYFMNESIRLYNKATGTVNSLLDGIYVSNGSLAGPWKKVAGERTLAAAGSAMKQTLIGKGYGPGAQAWYNQFLIVDPQNARHVFAGLEEVFESKDAGATWSAIAPYWNFAFACWAPGNGYPVPNTCPPTAHSDQHAAAVGTSGGTRYLFIGNDGGVYRRPLNGQTNKNGNATDWQSMNDGTMDALQYYAVSVGLADASAATNGPVGTQLGDTVVSGGLQDNGGSLVTVDRGKMSSNFGGDGGDVLVDPQHGCNIVQEYVYLSMKVTQNCARSTDWRQFYYLDESSTRYIGPPDPSSRFIAPFTADRSNIDHWLAGGHTVWFNDMGFAIRNGGDWKSVHTLPGSGTATAIGYDGDWAVVGWCGTCNNSGFKRGVAVGQRDGTTWTWTDSVTDGSTSLPNRYVAGAAAADDGTLYVVMNGFSRRFTEGPGAGVGHVFTSSDHGVSWTSLDGSGGDAFPDVPANSIAVTASGGLIVGTDLGVLHRASGSSTWKRLGSSFPTTVAIDIEIGPDGYVYAATHGRGIWRISAAGL